MGSLLLLPVSRGYTTNRKPGNFRRPLPDPLFQLFSGPMKPLAVLCGETKSRVLPRIPIQSLIRRRGVLRGRRRVSHVRVWGRSTPTKCIRFINLTHTRERRAFFPERLQGFSVNALPHWCSGFDECPVAVIPEGLPQLLIGIHHDRSLPCNRLADGFS